MPNETGIRTLKVPFRAPSGEIEEILLAVSDTGEPESQQAEEAAHYLETLAAQGHLQYEGVESPGVGATHRIRRNPDGTRVLERIRFGAA